MSLKNKKITLAEIEVQLDHLEETEKFLGLNKQATHYLLKSAFTLLEATKLLRRINDVLDMEVDVGEIRGLMEEAKDFLE